MQEFASTTITVHAVSLVKGLLEDLSKTNAISISVRGAATDAVAVAAPTFLGGLAGGRSGAIAGAVAGIGALILSEALGYGDYTPLMTALKKNCTEEELNSLYETLWQRLQTFFSANNIVYSASTSLMTVVQNNPELMQNIKNELAKIFDKNMQVN